MFKTCECLTILALNDCLFLHEFDISHLTLDVGNNSKKDMKQGIKPISRESQLSYKFSNDQIINNIKYSLFD